MISIYMISKNVGAVISGMFWIVALPVFAQVEVDATPNMRFVANFPYVPPEMGNSRGSDIEFGEFTVPVLDEEGNPMVDVVGDPIFEQRDFAFAGSQNNGIFIFNITNPENAFMAAKMDCEVNQADIQVRPDLGLLIVGVDSNTTQCGLEGT